jgi:diadenosine tetraphosphate (Ap4A) HIT family hydrolase
MKRDCPLCNPATREHLIWSSRRCRVILAADPDYPAFCRVIWRDHVAEMTQLRAAERSYFLSVVFAVEESLRRLLRPAKMNLASLGNQVPHLHWHVVPRFRDDAHFPDSIWSTRRRRGRKHGVDARKLAQSIGKMLGKKKAGR